MEILRSRKSLAVVAGMKKTNDQEELTKLYAKIKKRSYIVFFYS